MSSQITLNLPEGSLSFNFSPEAAQDLQRSISELMDRLKTVANRGTATPGKGSPQPPLEYRHTGEVFLEFFCNPNIWPTPFAAQVLITLRDDRIRLTTQVALTRLQEDLNQYLEQVG